VIFTGPVPAGFGGVVVGTLVVVGSGVDVEVVVGSAVGTVVGTLVVVGSGVVAVGLAVAAGAPAST
jgi:hypothetical protein